MAAPAARSQAPIVLIVEDDPTVRLYQRRTLTNAGYRVLEAPDGEKAVERLATIATPPDLVVSDVIMPRMTGVELARIVAARWPAVQMLLISAYGAPGKEYQGPFLPKPYTPEELVAKVATLLPPTQI
jgi:CheY-like chemotaxis protein